MIVKPAVTRSLVPAFSALLLTLSPMALSAEQGSDTASANERINFSGKLRMLSQRAAAAGCNLSADVDEQQQRQSLSLTSAEIWKILDGLKNGNSDLNINSEETDKAVLAALEATQAQWIVFDKLNMQLNNGDATTTDTDLLNKENLALLASAQDLVKSVLAAYADPSATDSGFGKVIDIAGRQRMLTQKMSKEACQIWSGQDSDEAVNTLQTTMALFENSMTSLKDGADGLIKPPNSEIEQGLNGVWQQWNNVKPFLQQKHRYKRTSSGIKRTSSNTA